MCGFKVELIRESVASLLQKIEKIELPEGLLLDPGHDHSCCGFKSELAEGLHKINDRIPKAAYKLLAGEFAKRSHEGLGTKRLS